MKPIVLDVAPYVRGIVAYDLVLQKQRLKLSNLVSQGGRVPKRMRTTRAAMSALEGGSRSTTRKERWFKADLNTQYVMQTAGEGWDVSVADATNIGVATGASRAGRDTGSSDGGNDSSDGSDDIDELA